MFAATLHAASAHMPVLLKLGDVSREMLTAFSCVDMVFFLDASRRFVRLARFYTFLLFFLSEHDARVTQVQALRAEMRGAYSEILGMDPEFCASKDVELLLWKNCYYKRIEVT